MESAKYFLLLLTVAAVVSGLPQHAVRSPRPARAHHSPATSADIDTTTRHRSIDVTWHPRLSVCL